MNSILIPVGAYISVFEKTTLGYIRNQGSLL